MARALGTTPRGHLAPAPASPRPPGPDLQRVLDLVHQASREASQRSASNGADAGELTILATMLVGIEQIILRGRQPGMTLAIGGVEGGGGLSLAAVPSVPTCPHDEIEARFRGLAADATRALEEADRRLGHQSGPSRQLAFWASLLGRSVALLDKADQTGQIPQVQTMAPDMDMVVLALRGEPRPFVPRPVAPSLPASPAHLRLLKGGER